MHYTIKNVCIEKRFSILETFEWSGAQSISPFVSFAWGTVQIPKIRRADALDNETDIQDRMAAEAERKR